MAIGNSDGSIILTVAVDKKELEKALGDFKNKGKNSTNTFGKGIDAVSSKLKSLAIQLGIVFSVRSILNFSKAAGEMATQTEASVQRLVDIYGSASNSVGDFIDENARALGMSKAAAAQYSSVYGNLFSVWADQATNAKLTNNYLNMTAVIASKTGREVSDVQERIRSGLLGNTEAIEDLGVFVNIKTIEITDAFQRIANGRSWEQLSAYEQQQVRTLAILEQATNKYGNEVEETSALTRNKFKAAYEDFQNTWGQVVNTVLMPIMEWATKALTYLNGVLHGLFGIAEETVKQSNNISSSTKNQNALTAAVEETAKAQEKATAGFDTLNILSSKASNEAKATGGAADISGLIPEVQSTTLGFEMDTASFQEGIEKGKELKGAFEPLIKIFSDLKTALLALGAAFLVFLGIKWLLNWLTSIGKKTQENTSIFKGFFDKLGSAAQAVAILWGLSEVIDSITGLIDTFSESGLTLGEVAGLLGIVLGELVVAFGLLLGILTKLNPSWKTIAFAAVVFLGFYLAIKAVTELIDVFAKSGLTFGEVAGALGVALGSVIVLIAALTAAAMILGTNPMVLLAVVAVAGALVLVLGALALALPPILDAFGQFIVETTPSLVLSMTVIGQAIEKIIYALGTVLPPIIQKVGGIFKTVFDGIEGIISSIGDSVVKILTEGIAGTIDKVLKSILNFVNKAGPAVNNFVDNIIAAVTKLINFIVSGIEYMVNRLVIDGVNGIIKGINSIGQYVGFTIPTVPQFTIPRFIPRLAQGAVIPPNHEFLAVLGDQKHGTNIEAPLDTIVEAVKKAQVQQGPQNVNIRFTGSLAELARVLKPAIELETRRDSVFA